MPDIAEYANRREIEAHAEKYDLCLPERQRASMMGELAGKRAGSSIEYQDRKDYVPGDDTRHIDWRAYARNDRLTIKLYREEICPTVDIIVDTSLSMSVTEEKATRRMDLTYLVHLLAGKLHASIRLHNLGRRMERMRDPFDLLTASDLRQDTPMPLLQASLPARQPGVKVLISDLLFPFAPTELVNTFAGADQLIIIQVLSEFEDDPSGAGEIRLEDAESRDYLDIRLDRATIEGYRKRLNDLRAELDRRLRVVGGAFACVRDIDPLSTMIRRLVEARIIEA